MKTWAKILLAIVTTIAIFTISWLILRFCSWVYNNHPIWFVYFILFVVFCLITGFIYTVIDDIFVSCKERKKKWHTIH